jgi:hypothetical protein
VEPGHRHDAHDQQHARPGRRERGRHVGRLRVLRARQRTASATSWYYSYADDESLAVATGATAEQIVRAVGSDSILLTRVGGSGESDLLYYSISGGLVEIAGTTASGLADYTKSVLGLDRQQPASCSTRTSGGPAALAICDPTTRRPAHDRHRRRLEPAGVLPRRRRLRRVARVRLRQRLQRPPLLVELEHERHRREQHGRRDRGVHGATGEVYFTREVSGSDVDLYYWNGTSARAVATAGGSAYSVLQGFADGSVVYSYDYPRVHHRRPARRLHAGRLSTVRHGLERVRDRRRAGDRRLRLPDRDRHRRGPRLLDRRLRRWLDDDRGDGERRRPLRAGEEQRGRACSGSPTARRATSTYWKKSGAVTTQITNNSATPRRAERVQRAL